MPKNSSYYIFPVASGFLIRDFDADAVPGVPMAGASPFIAAVSVSFVLLLCLSIYSAHPYSTDRTESQPLRNSMLISRQGPSVSLTREFYDPRGGALKRMNPFSAPEASHRIGGLRLLHDVPSGPNPISQDFPNSLDDIEGDKRVPSPASP